MKPFGYADLADLQEDRRIDIIGGAASLGNIVGVALEDDDEKIARYIEKLTKRFPTIRHISTEPGPVRGTVIVQVGPEAKH